MLRVSKFYLRVLKLAVSDKQFRGHAFEEAWHLVRQYLPARLVTRRRDYVFCRYLDVDVSKQPVGRWLPPQGLPYRLSAYGLLFDEAGRALMVRGDNLSFSWNLPGGGVNKGETLAGGLQREFEEETGLRVKVGLVISVTDSFVIMPTGRPVHAILHFFLVEVAGGTFQPTGNGFDTTYVDYVDLATVPDNDLTQAALIREVISKARALREFDQNDL
jgi:ADP-ribose pyrophosphatase YjhB (NUDIX family)